MYITTNAELKMHEKAKQKEKQEKMEWAKELLQKYEQERSKNGTVNIDSLVNQHIR